MLYSTAKEAEAHGNQPGPAPGDGDGGVNNSTLVAILVPCVIIVLVLVSVLVVYVVRHRRLQRSFLSFANSHYDTRSGRTTFSSADDLGKLTFLTF